jgi:uncharacterized protein (TIGR02757 family)
MFHTGQDSTVHALPGRPAVTGPPTLKPALDALYTQFNLANSASDPVWMVRRYEHPDDREIAGFCAAALAFGRVQSVLASIDGLLSVMAPSPAAFVRVFEPSRDRAAFDRLGHRWTRGADLAALIWLLRQMLDASGSLERFFARGLDPRADDVGAALESFSTRALSLDVKAVYGRKRPRPGVAFFFSRPSSGGACKRLNLFLRWMVRRDQVDLGVWTTVNPGQLVIPLDTHVIRVGRCLRLTRYRSPGWRMAADITRTLRALDPHDPVKYDFSLCHVGMMHACGFGRRGGDRRCPLRGACHP